MGDDFKVTRTMRRVYRGIVEALKVYASTLEDMFGDKILDTINVEIEFPYSELWVAIHESVGYEEACDSLRVYDKCDEFWRKLFEKVEFDVKVIIKPKLSFSDFLDVLKRIRGEA